MTTVESIKEIFYKFQVEKNKLLEKFKEDLPKILTPYFEESDNIQSISWTQYTPYFNDGDSCEFGRNEDLKVNGGYDYELSEKDSKLIYEMENIFNSIPEEFYLDLFGDHVRVTCHSDGRIEVEDYEHD